MQERNRAYSSVREALLEAGKSGTAAASRADGAVMWCGVRRMSEAWRQGTTETGAAEPICRRTEKTVRQIALRPRAGNRRVKVYVVCGNHQLIAAQEGRVLSVQARDGAIHGRHRGGLLYDTRTMPATCCSAVYAASLSASHVRTEDSWHSYKHRRGGRCALFARATVEGNG